MTTACPKLRTDLIIRSETDGNETHYVVKDPLTQRFFRLRAPDYYLLTRADGRTSAAEAARLTGERFGIRIPETAAAGFYEKMGRLLFFEGPAVERQQAASAKRLARSIWLIPLKAFDPDRVLARLIGHLRFLFTPGAVMTGLVLMAFATAVAAAQTSLWGSNLLALWQVASIPLLLSAVFVLALVHETGHALTLKHFGGTVHEVGFLLLYFQPCFYCNISDTYLLPERKERLYVGLSGLFFQGLATAMAILMWRVIAPGNIIADFLWVFIVISLAIFLFNFNPLIRLDGYYMLVDLLRIPNLRARAFRYWRGALGRWLIGRTDIPLESDPRLRRIYRWYGLAAATYTGLFLGWILYHITRWLHLEWGPAGVTVFYGLLLVFAMTMRTRNTDAADSADTAADSGQAPAAEARPWWRRRRPQVVWGGMVVLLILSAVIHLERRVGSSCETEAGSRYTVTAPSGGTLETELLVGGPSERRERTVVQATGADFSVIVYQLRVRESDSVHTGDTLLVLSSNRYQMELHKRAAEREQIVAERNLLVSGPKKDEIVGLRAEISEIEAQVENKRLEYERGQLLWDGQLISKEEFQTKQTELDIVKAQRAAKKSALAVLISEPKAEELAIKDAQISGLDAEIDFLRTQIAASTLVSPIAGIVTRVERAQTLVEVSDLDPVRLRLLVEEADIADVAIRAEVTLKVRSYPYRTFYGRVTRIAADADDASGRRRFTVITNVENPDLLLKPGMTGYAKIACGKRPALALFARRLIHFVRVEFWSWW